MATRLRHIGCSSVVIAYCGEEPLSKNLVMRSKDWAWPDGSHIEPFSLLRTTCPDCGDLIKISPQHVEPIPRDSTGYARTPARDDPLGLGNNRPFFGAQAD